MELIDPFTSQTTLNLTVEAATVTEADALAHVRILRFLGFDNQDSAPNYFLKRDATYVGGLWRVEYEVVV